MQEKRHNSTRRSNSSKNSSAKEKPRIEVSAGGLVYKYTPEGLYFAMLRDSFGKWTFPKGHVRKGETYDAAAAREIGEEMGVMTLKKQRPLGTIDIWFRDRFVYKGRLIHKYIHYYLFEAPQETRLRMPSPTNNGENIMEVSWVKAEEVTKRSTYKDLRVIIRRAMLALEQNPASISGENEKKERNRRRHQKRRFVNRIDGNGANS